MKKIVVLISGSGSNLEAIIESCTAKKINGKVIHVIRGTLDTQGLEKRRQRRSKYGAKRPKN